MQLKAEEVELLMSKGEDKEIENPQVLMTSSASTEKLQSLKDDETLAKLKVDCISSLEYLVLSLLSMVYNSSNLILERNPISRLLTLSLV